MRPDQAVELLLMGLRLREGVDLARHATLAGRPLADECDRRAAGHGVGRAGRRTAAGHRRGTAGAECRNKNTYIINSLLSKQLAQAIQFVEAGVADAQLAGAFAGLVVDGDLEPQSSP